MTWRSYGDHPLPSRDEALAASLNAFPSWYFRLVCERCGREHYLNQVHLALGGKGDRRIRDLIACFRHEGCGGRPRSVELVTGIPGASQRTHDGSS